MELNGFRAQTQDSMLVRTGKKKFRNGLRIFQSTTAMPYNGGSKGNSEMA